MSGPWGHQYLVAVTTHHPHIFCSVIQGLYFTLCLPGFLCPHLLDGPQTYTGGVFSPSLHPSVVSTPFTAPGSCWSMLDSLEGCAEQPLSDLGVSMGAVGSTCSAQPIRSWGAQAGEGTASAVVTSAPYSFPHVEQPCFCCMLAWKYLAWKGVFTVLETQWRELCVINCQCKSLRFFTVFLSFELSQAALLDKVFSINILPPSKLMGAELLVCLSSAF